MRTLSFFAILFGALLSASQAFASVITFDDLQSGMHVPVDYGVAGLNWSNAWVQNADLAEAKYGPDNGYVTGTVSRSNAIYNGWGDHLAFFTYGTQTFDLTSVDITALSRDGLEMWIFGADLKNNHINLFVTIKKSGPTHLDLNWKNIRYAYFYGQILLDGSGSPFQNNNQFVLDNIVIGEALPEPTTWLTMILGFAAIGHGMRRRQRHAVRHSFG